MNQTCLTPDLSVLAAIKLDDACRIVGVTRLRFGGKSSFRGQLNNYPSSSGLLLRRVGTSDRGVGGLNAHPVPDVECAVESCLWHGDNALDCWGTYEHTLNAGLWGTGPGTTCTPRREPWLLGRGCRPHHLARAVPSVSRQRDSRNDHPAPPLGLSLEVCPWTRGAACPIQHEPLSSVGAWIRAAACPIQHEPSSSVDGTTGFVRRTLL